MSPVLQLESESSLIGTQSTEFSTTLLESSRHPRILTNRVLEPCDEPMNELMKPDSKAKEQKEQELREQRARQMEQMEALGRPFGRPVDDPI